MGRRGVRVDQDERWVFNRLAGAYRARPGYPAAGSVVRDASGYPVLGTYPGPTVYARTAGSGHAGISGTAGGPKGDCLLCHAAHRGPNRYDGLLMQFRPTSASTLASDQARGTNAERELAAVASVGPRAYVLPNAPTDWGRYTGRSRASIGQDGDPARPEGELRDAVGLDPQADRAALLRQSRRQR
jgi:hypothetical protein